MKLYTTKGDGGETELSDGMRLLKDHHRMVACGEIDELNAAVGLAAACTDKNLSNRLRSAQEHLFALGSELAGDDPEKPPRRIDDEDVRTLEAWIDASCEQVGPLRNFVLPGGCEASARLHLARAVCRRAERNLVTLTRGMEVPVRLLRYMNRLSDLLFALARAANKQAGVEDVVWQPRGKAK